VGGVVAMAVSLLWVPDAPSPSAVADPGAGGCGVVVFDLYPHGDHMHVADRHPMAGGAGFCNDPVFLDEETLLVVFTPSSHASNPPSHASNPSAPAEGTADVGVDRGLPRIVAHSLSGLQPGVAPHGRAQEVGVDPRPTPDGTTFSFIRPGSAGEGGNLHLASPDGGAPNSLIPDVDDVVRHAWVDASTLALIRAGSPGVLWVVEIEEGTPRRVADAVVSGPETVPGEGAVTFVQSAGDRTWIRRVEAGSDSLATLVDTPPGSRAHAWMPPGLLGSGPALVMAHEGVVYRFEPGEDRFWHPIVNLNPYIGSFSGLALSPSGLRVAVVEGG